MVSLKIPYCTGLLLVMMWDGKMPWNERKWGEWHRHCDTELGCCWPCEDMLEEGSSTSRHSWPCITRIVESDWWGVITVTSGWGNCSIGGGRKEWWENRIWVGLGRMAWILTCGVERWALGGEEGSLAFLTHRAWERSREWNWKACWGWIVKVIGFQKIFSKL